jgi:hypothetical protein
MSRPQEARHAMPARHPRAPPASSDQEPRHHMARTAHRAAPARQQRNRPARLPITAAGTGLPGPGRPDADGLVLRGRASRAGLVSPGAGVPTGCTCEAPAQAGGRPAAGAPPPPQDASRVPPSPAPLLRRPVRPGNRNHAKAAREPEPGACQGGPVPDSPVCQAFRTSWPRRLGVFRVLHGGQCIP